MEAFLSSIPSVTATAMFVGGLWGFYALVIGGGILLASVDIGTPSP
jgi:hypothetical protein